MARVIMTDGKFVAGACKLSGRKRPVLFIEQDGNFKVYGSFSSEDCANEFMNRLGELVGAKIEPRREMQ